MSNLPTTSRLGFGLSSLAGSGNFRHQERLIRTAIDAGITHFDVAPYYGSGDAERILGKILQNCSEPVTITTKFGLLPPAGGVVGRTLRSVARPIFRRVAVVKTLATKILNKASKAPDHVAQTYEPGTLTESLRASVEKLGRPVDMFLLHEASLSYATDPGVLAELAALRKGELTTAVGISATAEVLQTALVTGSGVYQVAQLENSLRAPAPLAELRAKTDRIITHRAIQGGLEAVTNLLATRPDFAAMWERQTGQPALDQSALVRTLLGMALAANPDGTVLFSTRTPKRITQTAKVLDDLSLYTGMNDRVEQLINGLALA